LKLTRRWLEMASVGCSGPGTGERVPLHREVDGMKNVPDSLNKIVDVVLAYRPKPKTKAAKKRKRKQTEIDRHRGEGFPLLPLPHHHAHKNVPMLGVQKQTKPT